MSLTVFLYCFIIINVNLYILQPVLSDITSHQRLVDSVIEKAQGVLHSTNNPEVAAFITDINSRYEDLCQTAKVCMVHEHSIESLEFLFFCIFDKLL